MTSDISRFLSLHRIAIVGVSHDARHFSRIVYRAWRDRGYNVVPVNPAFNEIEGATCFPRVPGAEGALVLTPPAASEQVVKDCAEAGIRHVWLYRRSPAAEAFCATNGIDFITGECPMMYLPQQALIHRVHRWFHEVRVS